MSEIVTLSGPSGSGKTTTARALLTELPGTRMIPSHTTREARESDLPGEYRYLSNEQFDQLMRDGAFLWHAQPHGSTRYGTLASDIDEICDDPMAIGIMILVPDIVQTLHDYVWKRHRSRTRVCSFYIQQHNEELLRERLRERGWKDDLIAERLTAEADWHVNALDLNNGFEYIQGGSTLADLPDVVGQIVGFTQIDLSMYKHGAAP